MLRGVVIYGGGAVAVVAVVAAAATAVQRYRYQVAGRYRMQTRNKGIFVIINNFTCQDQGRDGTCICTEKLNSLFTNIGFDVQIHNNLTSKRISSTVARYAGMDHRNYDIFGMAILTRGRQGTICGTDEIFLNVQNLIGMFSTNCCPSLSAKPKLLLLKTPASDVPIADVILVTGRPTVGCEEVGCPFISALDGVLRLNSAGADMQDMLRRVDIRLRRTKKGTVTWTSTLTRRLFLNPNW